MPYLFGLHAVKAILARNPQKVQIVWLQENRHDQRLQQLQQLLTEAGIVWHDASRRELDQRVGGCHQGVVAACSATPVQGESFLEQLVQGLDTPPLLLVLDGITDPHNLGACLRTADAAGVHAVIATKHKSANLNATVAKVACGATESIPFVQVTNLVRCLKWLKQAGIWITGTASGEASTRLYEANLCGPIALVVGAEGVGMRHLTRVTCDQLVHIPMAGLVSSLNVSVATGICLFEVVRQRQG
jgi:23S rRNA (guanosine2251-2'-O)-methyltransferase